MLRYIVPKLAASLREDMVLQPKVYSQLLEMEFFPKWLTTLHLWLTQPTSDYDEVAQWCVVRLIVKTV
jgi:tuftelin-interacting protein 11